MQQLEEERRKVSKVGIWIGIAAIILAAAQILTMNEDAILWKLIANLFSIIRSVFSQ